MTDKLFSDISVAAARMILSSTPQLFRKYGSSEPFHIEPLATGILIKVNSVHFLITAAHVLQYKGEDINPEDIGIITGGNEFNILNGHIKFTRLSLHENNNNIDLAIWKIDDERVVKEIESKFTFLSPERIDITHTPVQESKYLIVGFPITRSKKKPNTLKIKVDPFIFLTKQSKKNIYSKLILQQHSNLIVDYRKRRIRNFNGSTGQGPDPYGLSGCGLWYLPEMKIGDDNRVESKLVGIMTEWHNTQNALVATRIHIVTEIIRKEFGLTLPVSEITQINLH
jgi:hypothetical protein